MIYEYELDYDAQNNVFLGYKYTVENTSGTSSPFTIQADGVTDDRPSLETLLVEIDNQGGGTLILPPNCTIAINSLVRLRDNITIRSTGNTIIKDLGSATTMFQCFGRKNVVVDNLILQGTATTSTAAIAIRESLDGVVRGKNITIQNCEFTDMTFESSESTASYISAKNIDNLTVRNCRFSKGSVIGVSISEQNSNVYIENNIFDELVANPIRVAGDFNNNLYTDGLWITDNEMNVGRLSNSYFSQYNITREPEGFVILPDDEPSLVIRRELTGISAINIAVSKLDSSTTHHKNVFIENNIANGPDYGFYDGGSADLYSLKDIERLKCTGNIARNSGDLGFAIERCHFSTISNNTADRSNSCGISIFDSSHTNVVGNTCSNNELSRDGAYEGHPYGGIRVERDSYSVLIEGNHFFATSNVKRSETNSISDGTYSYNEPGSPTQRYGVVVIPKGKRGVDENGIGYTYFVKPSTVKVGNNHAVGMLLGEVYNKMKGTQLVDTYTKFTYPTEADYPLGARLRNSLISTSTAAIKEWVVAHRIELEANASFGSSLSTIVVKTVYQNHLDIHGNPINNFMLQNTDLTTISPQTLGYDGDLIGIMLDDYSVHWTRVTAVDQIIVTDPETATCELTLADPLPAGVTVDNKIVSLRWEAI